MIHLVQFSNRQATSGLLHFQDGMMNAFQDEVTLHKPEQIAFAKLTSLGTKLKRKKLLEPIFSCVKKNDVMFFTDEASCLLLKPEELAEYRSCVVLYRDSADGISSAVLKGLRKRSEQVTFLALTEGLADEWKNTLGLAEKPKVIYPPLLNASAPVQPDQRQAFLVGVISDLEKDSGIETVIQAVHRIQEMLPHITLSVVGDGPERKNVLWLIDRLHMRRRVQFVSNQEHYRRFLPHLGVLVLPDIASAAYEPLVLEGLAAGIPVIATSTGFYKEVLAPEKAGLLFEPQNSHVLSQHLINLFNHPEWQAHYQEKGPQVVREFYSQNRFKDSIQTLIH